MAKLYFISRVVHEFYRLDEEAFTVGGCFRAHNHTVGDSMTNPLFDWR